MWTWLLTCTLAGPAGIDGGLEAWYRADEVLPPQGPVSQWTDLSPHGRHATGNGFAQGPDHLPSNTEIAGEPSVRFDGVDDELAFDGDFVVQSDYTVAVVAGRNGAGGGAFYVGGASRSSGQNLIFGYENSRTLRLSHYALDLDATVDAWPGSREWNLEIFALDGSTGRTIRRNGEEVASDTVTAAITSWADPHIGSFPAFSSLSSS